MTDLPDWSDYNELSDKLYALTCFVEEQFGPLETYYCYHKNHKYTLCLDCGAAKYASPTMRFRKKSDDAPKEKLS